MENWDKYTQLDIGAGTSEDDSFLHLDIVPGKHIEIIHNAVKTLPFPPNRFDKILMMGVWEHFTFEECREVIRNIYKVLKPNGILEFTTPDLMAVCKIILDDKLPFEDKEHNRSPMIYALNCLYGCTYESNMSHKWAWDEESIRKFLEHYRFKIELLDNNMYEPNTHLHIIAKVDKGGTL